MVQTKAWEESYEEHSCLLLLVFRTCSGHESNPEQPTLSQESCAQGEGGIASTPA